MNMRVCMFVCVNMRVCMFVCVRVCVFNRFHNNVNVKVMGCVVKDTSYALSPGASEKRERKKLFPRPLEVITHSSSFSSCLVLQETPTNPLPRSIQNKRIKNSKGREKKTKKLLNHPI